jgi:hypothetical protein
VRERRFARGFNFSAKRIWPRRPRCGESGGGAGLRATIKQNIYRVRAARYGGVRAGAHARPYAEGLREAGQRDSRRIPRGSLGVVEASGASCSRWLLSLCPFWRELQRPSRYFHSNGRFRNQPVDRGTLFRCSRRVGLLLRPKPACSSSAQASPKLPNASTTYSQASAAQDAERRRPAAAGRAPGPSCLGDPGLEWPPPTRAEEKEVRT